jgi:hypothetical protein
MQRIEIEAHFTSSVDRVYAYLAEHEHLGLARTVRNGLVVADSLA